MMFVGQKYLVNQVCSTASETVWDSLLSTCLISKMDSAVFLLSRNQDTVRIDGLQR